MKRLPLLACLCGLLLFPGCRWLGPPPREKVYSAHEAGLTLIYENPLNDAGTRFAERIQVRVASTKDLAIGRAVRITYSSFRGEFSKLYFQKDGGINLSQDGANPGLQIYPIGFPDRASEWEIGGTRFRILGRAVIDLHGLKLPETSDKVGVWVESQTPKGQRLRTFLLPDIGEAETLLWNDGSWICINRLVSRGFTDTFVPPQK